MKNNLKAIRHGECMLVPDSSAPTGKREQHTAFVVGHSETGHHHVLESKTPFETLLDEASKELYFFLTEDALLVHKKATDRHKDLVVPAGVYKRYHATEYDPFAKVIQDVAD